MNTSIYKESAVPGTVSTYLALMFVSIGLFILGFFISVYMFLAGLIGFFIALTLWSLARYHSIELSRDRLIVGRSSVALGDLDKSFDAQRAKDVLSDADLGSAELRLSAKTKNGTRILGGAWGRPVNGSSWIVVRESRSNDLLLIATEAARATYLSY